MPPYVFLKNFIALSLISYFLIFKSAKKTQKKVQIGNSAYRRYNKFSIYNISNISTYLRYNKFSIYNIL